MTPLDLMSYSVIATLLIYTPILCLMDWKHREVPRDTWTVLCAVGLASIVSLSLAGIYEWWMFIPSFMCSFIFFGAMKLGYIEGADWIFISLISLFFIYNPLSAHWFPILSFCIFFAAMEAVAAIAVVTWNYVHGRGISDKFERGFPVMIPLCAALWLTVVLA